MKTKIHDGDLFIVNGDLYKAENMKTNKGQSMETKTCDTCKYRKIIKKGTTDETEVCHREASTIYGESLHLIPEERTCPVWKAKI